VAASGSITSKFCVFSCSEDKLDTSFYNIRGKDVEYADFFALVHLVLILSYGSAATESGFSVNGG